jgi:hypothetical protein
LTNELAYILVDIKDHDILLTRGLVNNHPWKIQMKAWWYFAGMIVETDGRRQNHQQRTDFVAVIYLVGSRKGQKPGDQNESSLFLDDQNLQQCFWNGLCSLHQLPFSIQEWHYCYDYDSALLQPCYSYSPNRLFQGTVMTVSTGGSRLVQFHQGNACMPSLSSSFILCCILSQFC